jgi:hypothetical protein
MEEVEGPLNWSWLKSVEVLKRTRAIDLERTCVRRSDSPEGFMLEICVCGEWI